jgi:hypothetical protein
MSSLALFASDLLSIPARRGLGRLLSGMWEGDPVSWSIFGGIVVIGGVVFVVKNRAS